MAGAELQVMTLSRFLSGPEDGEDGMPHRCARADMPSTTVLHGALTAHDLGVGMGQQL